jgi:cell division protein ZapA
MTEKIEISLLGKTLQVTAPDEKEVRHLQAAARALDAKLQTIRTQNQTMPTERIAIMAALNIMHELLSTQREKQELEQAIKSSLNRIQEMADA